MFQARPALSVAVISVLALAGVRTSRAVPHVTATNAAETLEGLRAKMRAAKTDADWDSFLTAAHSQLALLNGSPTSRLEVARAEVHSKQLNAALMELRNVVDMGQDSELLESVPDFAPLRGIPEFRSIVEAGAGNRRPVSRSSVAFRLKDRGLVPEDIDYDPRTRKFFISSVLQKKIVSTTMQGDLTDFAAPPDGWPVFALKIDHAKQLLWASEVAPEGFMGVDPSARGRSALLCYELRTGKLIRRMEAPHPSALGDIALSSDGTVIASDGQHGAIYRVRPTGDQLERVDSGDFISPQTVAMAADGVHLIVPDYLRGLGLLDIGTKRVTWLSTQDRYALNGIDGLYRAGHRLIAVQNGTGPERVVIFCLDPKGTRIIGEQIIERATATLGDPTHGVVVDDSFYYIANSGWDALDDSGNVKPGVNLTDAMVMRAPLQPNRER